jgi:hypothetical protein
MAQQEKMKHAKTLKKEKIAAKAQQLQQQKEAKQQRCIRKKEVRQKKLDDTKRLHQEQLQQRNEARQRIKDRSTQRKKILQEKCLERKNRLHEQKEAKRQECIRRKEIRRQRLEAQKMKQQQRAADRKELKYDDNNNFDLIDNNAVYDAQDLLPMEDINYYGEESGTMADMDDDSQAVIEEIYPAQMVEEKQNASWYDTIKSWARGALEYIGF